MRDTLALALFRAELCRAEMRAARGRKTPSCRGVSAALGRLRRIVAARWRRRVDAPETASPPD